MAGKSDKASLPDLILFLWSFVCVGLVAFPLGILSGCMGAVHVHHRLGRESTIPGCLKMVLPRAWPLWLFHWILAFLILAAVKYREELGIMKLLGN